MNEEKNLQFTKIPEQKKNKANDTFQLLAKWCDFRNIIGFISFIREQLIQNLDGAKNQGKFDQIFNYILDGFSKNPSMKHEHLIPISYSLIRDSLQLIAQTKVKERLLDTTIKDEIETKDKKVFNLAKKYEILETTAQNKSIFKHIQDDKKRSDVRIGYTLSTFGLKMCIIGIKSNIFAPEKIENDEYSYDQGKMVVFEVLMIIIKNFPENIIQFFGEILIAKAYYNKTQIENIVELINFFGQQLNEKKELKQYFCYRRIQKIC
ncbi:hypothetical protein IMG5_148320 [Ichthyophthirius multifiliis]|uniref:U3 small nucleolar RNA-associated protein 20 domain-containing protein n=1 Tax=Ichthyophthirius multifiliis TaxID=5932 RepID=G0QYA0_ICHMU|nr:hypothetical protein IMG5_148320 [Ichthyophthirius multifiliis]EGR29804.1 hypothetical protein IMG5_148320 [Ichthyophthirius multifiliis]|eukprot:XP_004031040.1 hypothetical protein IMG5_148320 [Ichthyophthirius multifiliis]